MKKTRIIVAAVAVALVISVLFCGCASNGGGYYDNSAKGAQSSSASYSPSEGLAYDEDYYYDEAAFDGKANEGLITELGGGGTVEAAASQTSSRKIIMTARYTIETKEYDDSYSKLFALADEMGGYVSAAVQQLSS